jgi:hypothetical protein
LEINDFAGAEFIYAALRKKLDMPHCSMYLDTEHKAVPPTAP